jgi:hypothetical protein
MHPQKERAAFFWRFFATIRRAAPNRMVKPGHVIVSPTFAASPFGRTSAGPALARENEGVAESPPGSRGTLRRPPAVEPCGRSGLGDAIRSATPPAMSDSPTPAEKKARKLLALALPPTAAHRRSSRRPTPKPPPDHRHSTHNQLPTPPHS